MGAKFSLWPRSRVTGSFSANGTTVVLPWDSGGGVERVSRGMADLANWMDVIATARFSSAKTETSNGTNITSAKMVLVLNTVEDLESWRSGGSEFAPDGPAWKVAELTVLATTGDVSPRSNVWLKVAREFQDATNDTSTPPVDRYLFASLEIYGGGTAGTYDVDIEVTANAKRPG